MQFKNSGVCGRCNGGRKSFKQYKHVNNGLCFLCNGSGKALTLNDVLQGIEEPNKDLKGYKDQCWEAYSEEQILNGNWSVLATTGKKVEYMPIFHFERSSMVRVACHGCGGVVCDEWLSDCLLCLGDGYLDIDKHYDQYDPILHGDDVSEHVKHKGVLIDRYPITVAHYNALDPKLKELLKLKPQPAKWLR
ncbi:hypothetical protein [Psychromonas sp. Urea-02u-13]|uniref:hypothetical protein n=1 Tax=Psychromonas sp. Urea-02u-13 TaxID=2058326 RepID=UPI000C3371C3|nr:hypothetical protein [Psychromonas sp. Urea-02u-13]PKG40202.1 hypothetical protein CXF74_03785 [Psychromonas sp. Urea-02u-13]